MVQIVYVVSVKEDNEDKDIIAVISNISILHKAIKDYFGEFSITQEEIIEDSGIDRYLTILDFNNEKHEIVIEDFELVK